MLNTTTNGVFVPDYVAIRYGKFVTDAEFRLLLVLGSIPESGAKALRAAAIHLGYKSTAPITKMLTTLADRNVIRLANNEVDATPLWLACYEEMGGVELPLEKEPKKDNRHYKLAAELGGEDNIHSVAQIIKGFLGKHDENDIKTAYELANKLRSKVAKTKETYLLGLMLDLLAQGLDETQITNYINDCYDIRVKKAKNGMVWVPTAMQLSAKVNVDNWRSKKLGKRSLMDLAD